jgi:hypothetical protein
MKPTEIELTPPLPKKSKYDFNGERCKKAIESLSKMVYDNGYTAIPTRDKVLLGVILDDLILDIEALHCLARERDDVLESMYDLPISEVNYTEAVYLDDILQLYHCYTDDDGILHKVPDLEL